MALANISLRFKFPPLQSSSSSSSTFNTLISPRKPSSIVCSKPSSNDESKVANDGDAKPRKKLSEQSSWEVKDSEGKDYLYRLGAEADNVNIAVGARSGIIDDVFIGDFLGKDCKVFGFWFKYKDPVLDSDCGVNTSCMSVNLQLILCLITVRRRRGLLNIFKEIITLPHRSW